MIIKVCLFDNKLYYIMEVQTEDTRQYKDSLHNKSDSGWGAGRRKGRDTVQYHTACVHKLFRGQSLTQYI